MKITRKTILVTILILTFIGVTFITLDILSAGDWGAAKAIKLYFTPTTVGRGAIRAQVIFPGTIDFGEHAVFQFQQIPTNGVMISSVNVQVGDMVKKGQLVASLDQKAIQKQLQIELANYWKTRLTFDQTYSDAGARVPSDAMTDTLKRTLQSTQADLDISVYNLESEDLIRQFSNLYSPLDGIITRVDAPVAGVNIQSADEAKFEVINPKTMFFNADVDETEVDNLHVGDKGVLILNAFPTDYIQATIQNIAFSPHQDTNGNTVYTVKLTLDNKTDDAYLYKLGMGGNIIFYEYNDNILTVKNEFIHQDDNGAFLKVGKAKKVVYVQTGITNGKVTEIQKGVSEGDIISY